MKPIQIYPKSELILNRFRQIAADHDMPVSMAGNLAIKIAVALDDHGVNLFQVLKKMPKIVECILKED